MKKYSIINACSDFGVHVNGAKLGPETISKDIKEIELGTKYQISILYMQKKQIKN